MRHDLPSPEFRLKVPGLDSSTPQPTRRILKIVLQKIHTGREPGIARFPHIHNPSRFTRNAAQAVVLKHETALKRAVKAPDLAEYRWNLRFTRSAAV